MLEKWKRMEPALNLLAANNPNVRQRYLTDFDRINIDDTIVLLSPIERSTHFLSASNSLIDESASFTITHYFGKFLPLIIIFLVINNAPHLIIPNMVFLVVPHDVDFQFLDTQELSGKEFVMQKYYLTDEEFVSKEDLATARLYFKRPGRIRRLFLESQRCLKLKVLTSFFRNIIFFDIYDKDVFGDIKINSCEFFLALQGNSHKFRLQLRTIG
ncbi:unnamed protein product [Rhizophagus irregularis]|nr:unnamed protein product [Rhizophagus irregularis]